MIRSIVLLLFLVAGAANAQFVAFVGKDANAPDEFSFVALTDIPAATTIYFTNREWDNTTGAFLADGEGTLAFTTTGIIPQGTVTLIQTPDFGATFTDTSEDSMGASQDYGAAVLVAGSANVTPTSQDPFYAFAASNAGDPIGSVTEIYAYLQALTPTEVPSFTSADPTTGTAASPNAVAVVVQSDPRAVAVDYNADRSTASPTTLENSASFSTGASITLDLTFFTSSSLPVELQEFDVE